LDFSVIRGFHNIQRWNLNMDVFNQLIKVVYDAMPVVQSGIPSIVGGFITAMFLRGNTQRVEFEKIKMGKVQEAVDDLVQSHELTLTELIKCKNLLKIAKLADREYKGKNSEDETNTRKEFDFDWFLRFFEGAGNISNEDMQLFWARILAGEVQQKGTFSLRMLETLRNLTQIEAMLIQQVAPLVLTQVNREKYIYCDNLSTNLTYEPEVDEVNEAYGINDKMVSVMIECGILGSAKKQYRVSLLDGSTYIFNGNIIVMFQSKSNQKTEEFLEYYGYEVTQIGVQIMSVLDVQPNNDYILDLSIVLKKKYPDFAISAYGIQTIDGDNIIIDTKIDVLSGYKSKTSDNIDLQWRK